MTDNSSNGKTKQFVRVNVHRLLVIWELLPYMLSVTRQGEELTPCVLSADKYVAILVS